MIDVRPMLAEDMMWVLRHGVKEANIKADKKAAKEREESGMCVTGWVNGRPECVAGIDLLWEGVGDVWLMVTPRIDTMKREGFVCIRKGLKKLIKDNKIRRLQSYARIDFPECHTLFKHLGFIKEGTAKGYCPDGSDAILYARIRND